MTALVRIGVWSLARLLAGVFGCIGLFLGVVYSVGGLVFDIALTGSVNAGTALAFFALLGMPMLFALFGLFIGTLVGWLFNWVSKHLGGLELTLVDA